MASEPNGRYPTWKWLAVVLVGLLMMIGGNFLMDVRSEVRTLQDRKVDKDAYYRDIDGLKQTMCDMDKKLDRLLSRGR